jgi:NADPH:quinone reductase-like Zn-dependent oxidoreductase
MLGADHAFNYRHTGWVPDTIHATDGRGVDVVLDCVGAPYLEHHLEVLAVGGRLVVIGLQGGARADLDLAVMMRKRLSIIGSTLRTRPVAEKGRIVTAFRRRFGHALESGAVRPIIDRVLPLDHAAEAHRLLADGEIFGKVVLAP